MSLDTSEIAPQETVVLSCKVPFSREDLSLSSVEGLLAATLRSVENFSSAGNSVVLYPHFYHGPTEFIGEEMYGVLREKLGAAPNYGQEPIFFGYATTSGDTARKEDFVAVSRLILNQTSNQLKRTYMKADTSISTAGLQGNWVHPDFRRARIRIDLSTYESNSDLSESVGFSDLSIMVREQIAFKEGMDILTATTRPFAVNLYLRNGWTPLAQIVGGGTRLGDKVQKLVYVKCRPECGYDPSFVFNDLLDKERPVKLFDPCLYSREEAVEAYFHSLEK